MNRRVEYLTEMIRSPKAKASYLCDVWNKITKLERMAAKTDATGYIREKTKNDLLLGRAAGDLCLLSHVLRCRIGNGSEIKGSVSTEYLSDINWKGQKMRDGVCISKG